MEWAKAKPVSTKQTLGEVLQEHLELLDIFLKNGFPDLQDPQKRAALASLTIEQLCQRYKKDLHKLLWELNDNLIPPVM